MAFVHCVFVLGVQFFLFVVALIHHHNVLPLFGIAQIIVPAAGDCVSSSVTQDAEFLNLVYLALPTA